MPYTSDIIKSGHLFDFQTSFAAHLTKTKQQTFPDTSLVRSGPSIGHLYYAIYKYRCIHTYIHICRIENGCDTMARYMFGQLNLNIYSLGERANMAGNERPLLLVLRKRRRLRLRRRTDRSRCVRPKMPNEDPINTFPNSNGPTRQRPTNRPTGQRNEEDHRILGQPVNIHLQKSGPII